ncbi:MAG: hypothetical protein LBQ00_06070 [Syntrophobacterales bacterium]|jgi:hypothetical protein|nr:hypothetical protein [Syntrophobacterales bacterium]
MKKTHVKFLGLVLLAFSLIFTFSAVALAEDDPYFKGSGTIDDPFLVSTSTDLLNVANASRNTKPVYNPYAAAYYKLTNDIDLTGVEWTVPIGSGALAPFSGDFDGAGFEIQNFTPALIPAGVLPVLGGMFSKVTGKIHDLSMVNVNIRATTQSIGNGMGGLVQIARDGAVIENCHVTGTIELLTDRSSYGNVGGIVGFIAGEGVVVSNCSFEGTIIAPPDSIGLGGIVGTIQANNGTTIVNCFSAGEILRTHVEGNREPNTVGKIAGQFHGTGGGFDNRDKSVLANNYTTMKITATGFADGLSGYDGEELPVEEPPVSGILVNASATASVEKLSGSQNNLTIIVTEYYSDETTKTFTTTVSIKNNAAGTYEVGEYTVYVDTKGNDQIRDCHIVS